MSEEAQPLNLVMPGRSLSAGSGWSWIQGGWSFFIAAPGMWIVMMIMLVVGAVVFSVIPLIGSFAWQVVSPVFEGKSMLESQRLVLGAIAHLMKGNGAPVHAIDSLKTRTS